MQPESEMDSFHERDVVNQDITFPQFGQSCNLHPNMADHINDTFITFRGKIGSFSGIKESIKSM